MDWMIRIWVPDWLDDCGTQYATHTAALRATPEIAAVQNLLDVTPVLVDVAKVAGDAAWDAAWDAARAAAMNAAWAAARNAARNAARAKLSPAVESLQASASDLVRRMCSVKS